MEPIVLKRTPWSVETPTYSNGTHAWRMKASLCGWNRYQILEQLSGTNYKKTIRQGEVFTREEADATLLKHATRVSTAKGYEPL